MREWLAGISKGYDGEPSVANVLLFVGGGMLLGIALIVLVACAVSYIAWDAVVGPLEYLKDLFKWIAAPYLGKKFSGMFRQPSQEGVAPDGFGN